MSYYIFHDESSPLSFLYSLNFIGGGVLQGQRMDTQGQEINGIEMRHVKDTKNKV